jgi:flagellar hook-length control protein FliK
VNHARLAEGVRSIVVTGQNQARIDLEPAELGHMVVHVRMEGGQLLLNLHTLQADAQQAVQAALPALQSSLEQQGLRVGGITVTAGAANLDTSSSWNPGQGAGQGQQWQGRHPGAPWASANQPYTTLEHGPRQWGAAMRPSLAGAGVDYWV